MTKLAQSSVVYPINTHVDVPPLSRRNKKINHVHRILVNYLSEFTREVLSKNLSKYLILN